MAGQITEACHSCEICGLDRLTDDSLRTHMASVHLEGAVTCPFCDLADVTSKEMLIHVNSVHLDYLTPENELIAFIDEDDIDSPVEPLSLNEPCQPCRSEPSTSSNLTSGHCSGLTSLGLTGGTGENGPGSPSRSKLALHLRPEKSHPSQELLCPMCPYSAVTAARLEEHVNREHLDPLSPSSAAHHKDEALDCPICSAAYINSAELEMHVNLEHLDVLSPCKPVGGSSEGCPICKMSNFKCDRDLALHLEAHYKRSDSTPDVAGDQLLARAVEQQERYNRHLQEKKEFDMLRAQYGMDNQGNFKEQSVTNMQRAVYSGELTVADYYERKIELSRAENSGIDDQRSCSKGVIRKIYSLSSMSSNVVRTYVCTTVDHYASTYGDKGWGCGYRNIQMLLSSLIHHTGFNDLMFRDTGGIYGMNTACRNSMPSISRIQRHIEWAWGQGFDKQGCDQLGGKLHNTRKWIGTTETITFLASLRFRCELIDFHQPTSADGSHPQLFNWILQYFQKEDDFKPPLYLQHQGHSRTVIGVEVLPRGINLLVLDPSHSPRQMSQLCDTTTSSNVMRLIRKASGAMRARQYQVVCVTGILQSEQEYQRSKVLTSTRIP